MTKQTTGKPLDRYAILEASHLKLQPSPMDPSEATATASATAAPIPAAVVQNTLPTVCSPSDNGQRSVAGAVSCTAVPEVATKDVVGGQFRPLQEVPPPDFCGGICGTMGSVCPLSERPRARHYTARCAAYNGWLLSLRFAICRLNDPHYSEYPTSEPRWRWVASIMIDFLILTKQLDLQLGHVAAPSPSQDLAAVTVTLHRHT